MVSSNFSLRLESTGKEHFIAAMKMCFDAHSAAKRFSISPAAKTTGSQLSLMWFGTEGNPLPYEMTVSAATDFVWNWLHSAERTSEPDLDGHCAADGYIITSNHGFGDANVFVTIEAVWSEYHK